MKSIFWKINLGLILILMVNAAQAQTKKKSGAKTRTSKTNTSKTSSKNPFGGASTTTKSGNPFGGNTKTEKGGGDPFATKTGGDPFASGNNNNLKKDTGRKNIPVEVIPSATSNPLSSTLKTSMRPDGIIERNLVKDRKPLEYEHIREDDAVYLQRIWREIDAREKINQTFVNPSMEDNGSQLFFAILFKAVTQDSVLAFEDDRFTIPILKDKFIEKLSGGIDTSDVIDIDGVTVLRREVRTREFPIDSIYRFQIKEEIVFDKESSRMHTRILGIAPTGPTIIRGKVYPSENTYPLFWVYYPDLRPILAKYSVYNGKNFGGRISWEDLFEGRMFSSYMLKSTVENPYDKTLIEIVKNDKLFRLLEGENIKEKIFNYEQNLWQY